MTTQIEKFMGIIQYIILQDKKMHNIVVKPLKQWAPWNLVVHLILVLICK